MKICQIKGTNGSGKTTIVKQLLHVSQDVEELTTESVVYATVMKDLGWTAIGRYPEASKMGGCDMAKSVQAVKCFIEWAMNDYPDNWIVFEGMMISTIKSTFYDYLMGMHARNKNIVPVFVILRTTLSGCAQRIDGRGTKKPNLNYENIYNKARSILQHAQTYDQKYVRYMDVEDLELGQMLPEFLQLVGDKDLLEAL